MDTLPKPNTQALSWFFGENEKGTLLLQAKYQRNPIWSIGQKCFLIDSIISACPIPQVYINIKTESRGRDRKTLYEVVDGQQRLRAILEFMNDEWALVSTTARSYPVSELYKPHIGKKYSELPNALQNAIWNYSLAVQELRDWDDQSIRMLFRRLNYVVEKLNKQELRHSQYFGEFVEAVEHLANNSFWDETEFFSRRDFQRMKDVEFVSELFVIIIDGIQDQQKTLDKFYADYDVVFPKRTRCANKFKQVLDSLRTIKNLISTTRFKKKADFYGLFSAVAVINEQKHQAIDLRPATNALTQLSEALDQPSDDLPLRFAQYYSTVIEGPNKLAKRKLRQEILLEVIKEHIAL